MTLTDRDRKLVLIVLPVALLAAYWFLLLAPKREEASKLGTDLAAAEVLRDEAVAKSQNVTGAKTDFAADFAEVLRVGKAIPTGVDMPALLLQLDRAAGGTDIAFKSIKAGQRTAAQPLPPATPVAQAAQAAQTEEGAPADAGGEAAASAPGEAAETAAEGAETADSASAASGADPASTGTAAPAADGTTTATAAPGLDTVPLDFTFEGDFFELANFFHRLKRFVHVRDDRIVVGGRLMTIDTFTLSMGESFPTLTAEMTATVYLAPLSEGATAGATPAGPGAVAPDATQPAGDTAPAPAPTASTSAPAQ